MSAWFEDDTLWESLESFLFSQLRSSEMTVREAEQILTLLHPPQDAAVLDLCCGPGRHSLEFARHGFQVTGVDRTARYLDTARAAATREGLTVEFVQEDMRHFQRPAAFDVALNLSLARSATSRMRRRISGCCDISIPRSSPEDRCS